MPTYSFHHIHLLTRDPKATAQYYHKMFGAKLADLKAKGAEFGVEPETIRPGVRIAYVRGPENARIELVEHT
jgi:catechol 2,3-dioxygenase-like lactoylglutathione lyase family enzyme